MCPLEHLSAAEQILIIKRSDWRIAESAKIGDRAGSLRLVRPKLLQPSADFPASQEERSEAISAAVQHCGSRSTISWAPIIFFDAVSSGYTPVAP